MSPTINEKQRFKEEDTNPPCLPNPSTNRTAIIDPRGRRGGADCPSPNTPLPFTGNEPWMGTVSILVPKSNIGTKCLIVPKSDEGQNNCPREDKAEALYTLT